MFIVLQAAVTLALLVRKPRALATATVYFAAIGICFLPWLPNFLWHFKTQGSGPQNPKPDSNIAASFYDYANGLFNHGQTESTVARIVTAAFFMTMLAATIQFVVVLRRAEPHERKWHWTLAIIMLAWLLAPFTFAYIKSVYSASVFTHRNLTISLPAVYLIAARGMLAIPLPKFGRTALVAAIAMLAFTRLATSGYYAAPHKD